ncbi:MAG: ribosome-associated translation inhibitor RaiA [Chloroflexota bacterium]
MKTTLHARHLELDQRLKDRIERKLQRLDRVADPPVHATVELTAKASRTADAAHVAEITLVTNGATLRSTSSAATPMAAVDAVIDKLERQVVRAKERLRKARRVPAALRREPVSGGETSAPAPREQAGVVEFRRVDMVPMFPEDAIARMEELGQAFFVFLNAQTRRVSVVYRRADGGHGLIDPIVAP